MRHRPLRGAGRTLSLRGFDLECQPTSQLDNTLGALRPGDLGVVTRREGCCRVAETHQVEGIGGFSAELEDDSVLEGNVAEDSQVDIAESRSENGVARHIAIGATRSDAPWEAGAVVSESCRIEPRRHLTVGGANPAAVMAEDGVNAGNGVGTVRARTIKVLGGSCEHI